MQYALFNNKRHEAFVGGHGICPLCGAPTISKCGSRVLHHWAHARKRDCDPWWENETEWHREWKSWFPAKCREVSYTAPGGEVHRADVVTPTGIVVEFQHSAMSDEERYSREIFYKNLVWVVDGRSFRANFDIYHFLPDPASELAKDLIWYKATRSMKGAARGLFLRKSEMADHTTNGWMHGIGEIEEDVNLSYRGHHQYDWVRPRKTWLDATCPTYIDFGENELIKLETYGNSRLRCIYRVCKRKFLNDLFVESDANALATKFYPLSRTLEKSTKPE